MRTRKRPPISLIFAARDEAEKLRDALATMLAQDYPRYEVIAVNDRSRDATSEIMHEFARANSRLKVIDIAELPAGWLGKPHALTQGARQATGEWLVFTDADVHFAPDVLRRAVRMAVERKWDHLALFSGFDLAGFWEITTITFFCVGFIFGNEPWNAANPRSGRYVGIGAFQMLRRPVYDAIGGYGALAMEVIEDMKVGKLVKRGGFRSGLGNRHGIGSPALVFGSGKHRARAYEEYVRGHRIFAAAGGGKYCADADDERRAFCGRDLRERLGARFRVHRGIDGAGVPCGSRVARQGIAVVRADAPAGRVAIRVHYCAVGRGDAGARRHCLARDVLWDRGIAARLGVNVR